jgi:hypothetical protein
MNVLEPRTTARSSSMNTAAHLGLRAAILLELSQGQGVS